MLPSWSPSLTEEDAMENPDSTSDSPPEEDWATCEIRIDRADPPGSRRLPKGRGQEFGRVPVRWPTSSGSVSDDQAIRTSRRRLDCQHRVRSALLRHSFTPTNQGDTDLPPHWQPSSCAAFAWPYQDRKHCQTSRHRGR